VYRAGARAAGRFVVVFALPRDRDQEYPRFGITASRKVGGAVVRSRVKRRLREILRTMVAPEMMAVGVDVVVNARLGCDSVPWDDLSGDLSACVRRAVRSLCGNEGHGKR
jgi:ribonuclease P protein component